MVRFAAIGLALAVATAAPAGVAAIAVPESAFQKYVPGNGLTLIVHEDHEAPIAAVDVWYHLGSIRAIDADGNVR